MRRLAESVRSQEPGDPSLRQAAALRQPRGNSRKGVPARTAGSSATSSSSWAVTGYSPMIWQRRKSIGLPARSGSRFGALSSTFLTPLSAPFAGSVALAWPIRPIREGSFNPCHSCRECWQVYILPSFTVAIPCLPSHQRISGLLLVTSAVSDAHFGSFGRRAAVAVGR